MFASAQAGQLYDSSINFHNFYYEEKISVDLVMILGYSGGKSLERTSLMDP